MWPIYIYCLNSIKNKSADNKSVQEMNESKLHKTNLNPYSSKYRILKTILMVFAWISFGINQELARITLEDLKILLEVNYEGISFVILMRFAGAMVSAVFSGYLMNTFSLHMETILAVGKLLMATGNLFISTKKKKKKFIIFNWYL